MRGAPVFWQEETEAPEKFQVPEDIADLSFKIRCKALPLDHAHAFSRALHEALPWLAEEPEAGVHLIHGAESGNGWYRPEEAAGQLLHLSRRARMALRLPSHRFADAGALVGARLDIDGHLLEVGEYTIKPFSILPTQFARYVVGDPAHDEATFLEGVVTDLAAMGIPVRKVMCGRNHTLETPDGSLHTRSVMVADLEPADAVRLQREGLGPHRRMGCGLFMPHKGIKPVGDQSEKSHFSGN